MADERVRGKDRRVGRSLGRPLTSLQTARRCAGNRALNLLAAMSALAGGQR